MQTYKRRWRKIGAAQGFLPPFQGPADSKYIAMYCISNHPILKPLMVTMQANKSNEFMLLHTHMIC